MMLYFLLGPGAHFLKTQAYFSYKVSFSHSCDTHEVRKEHQVRDHTKEGASTDGQNDDQHKSQQARRASAYIP